MDQEVISKEQSTGLIQLPGMGVDLKHLQEGLLEELGTGALSARKLTRIRIDKFAFLLQDMDGTTMAPNFRGVILHHHTERAFWPEALKPGENKPPACSSLDGIIGIGNPGGKCRGCPMAEWGSGKTADGRPSRGQACKQSQPLFIFREGNNSVIPELLSLPPTSLRNWENFARNLIGRVIGNQLIHISRYLVEFGIDSAGTGSMTYGKATLRVVKLLPEELHERISALRDIFKPLFETSSPIVDSQEYTQAPDLEGAF